MRFSVDREDAVGDAGFADARPVVGRVHPEVGRPDLHAELACQEDGRDPGPASKIQDPHPLERSRASRPALPLATRRSAACLSRPSAGRRPATRGDTTCVLCQRSQRAPRPAPWGPAPRPGDGRIPPVDQQVRVRGVATRANCTTRGRRRRIVRTPVATAGDYRPPIGQDRDGAMLRAGGRQLPSGIFVVGARARVPDSRPLTNGAGVLKPTLGGIGRSRRRPPRAARRALPQLDGAAVAGLGPGFGRAPTGTTTIDLVVQAYHEAAPAGTGVGPPARRVTTS